MIDLKTSNREPLRIASRPWRPRPSLLLVGLIMVLAAILGVGALVTSVSGQEAILVMADTVPAGQVIAPSDLRIVNISKDTGGLAVVLFSEEASVVGRPAAITLTAGSPVMLSQLGPVQLPAGQAVMGVLVKPGQYPPALAVGDTVEVLDTGSASAPAPQNSGSPVYATVTAIDTPQDSAVSGEVVSLRLDTSDATQLAPAVAANAVTLLLVSAGS